MPKRQEGPPYPGDKDHVDPSQETGTNEGVSEPAEVASNGYRKGLEALAAHPLAPKAKAEDESVPEALVAAEELPKLGTRTAPETLAEARQQIKGLIDAHVAQGTAKRIDDEPRRSAAEQEKKAASEKEKAYLTAYKELEQKRTLWNRLRNGKDLNAEEARVQELKKEYDEARVAYANALTESARYRLEKDGTTGAKVARTIERYNRLVRFNEVVKPAMERKLKARQEALDARGRNVLEKALVWSARHNASLEKKFGKNGARALRAAASAILVTGGAAALGSFGAAGAFAIAGFASFKFARAFGGMIVGASAGESAAKLYEKLRGKKLQQHAAAKLKNAGRDSGELTADSLAVMDRSRERLLVKADEATLAKRTQRVRLFTALGFGAGTSALLASLDAVNAAADVAADTHVQSADAPAAEFGAHSVTAEASGSGVSASPIESIEKPVELASATIGRGEGFNELFVDLRASGTLGDSAVARHVLDRDFTASQLSDEVQALTGGKSAVMLEGDRVYMDERGLWFSREGAEPKLLMENDATAPEGYVVHELTPEEVDYKPDAAPVREAYAAVQPAEQVAVSPVPVIETIPAETGVNHEAALPAGIEPIPVTPLETLGADASAAGSAEPQPQATGVTAETTAPASAIETEAAPTDSAYEAPANPETASSAHLNAHGVDMSKPGIAMVDGKFFAHGGADNDANYALALEYARELGKSAPGTPVYWIDEHLDPLGGLERTVHALVFDPDSGQGRGMVVPYASQGGLPTERVAVPGPDDYEPVPNRR